MLKTIFYYQTKFFKKLVSSQNEGLDKELLQVSKSLASRNLSTRLQAISRLKEIICCYPQESYKVSDIVASFIRNKTTTLNHLEMQQVFSEKVSEDIQAALTLIGEIPLLCSFDCDRAANSIKESMINLSHTDIRGANLNCANLKRVIFKEAILYQTNLCSANLSHVNLEGAILSAANLQKANLEGANLKGAILSAANLCGANLFRANLDGANMYLAKLEDTIFDSSRYY
ncbi:MAG: pentapeptide repeat-containing protein [Cyanobacteria bacterium P01_A01_bin.45]